MKAVAAKKWIIRVSSCLAVGLILLPAVASAADQYPYVKVYGGDVNTGAWFNSANSGCTSGGLYQSGTASSPFTGGIVTFDNNGGGNGNGGSSGQYGVLAQGTIDTVAGTPATGFYSGGSQPGSSASRLSFASYGNLGNFGGGSQPSDQCIPDYFDNAKQGTPQTMTGNTFTSFGTGQYAVTPVANVPYTLSASVIGASQNISLFVNGDVYINGNITYQTHNNVNTASKFALVARGNIYIDPNVTELDGWYIAQPVVTPTPGTATSVDGIIWDCHNGTPATGLPVQSTSITSVCQKQLTIDGALTAKFIDFDRINGNVLTANSGSGDGSATTDSNAAEVINYSPDMILGGPFFNLSPGAPKVESLNSLPPVF